MMSKRAELSGSELEVLKALWHLGAGNVRQLQDLLGRRGRTWAYTTVLTLLNRLDAKGYVASDKSDLAHVFRPRVSREKLLRQRLADLADGLCEGTATPLVQALVQAQRFSPEEIEGFRRLLDEMEVQGPSEPGTDKSRKSTKAKRKR